MPVNPRRIPPIGRLTVTYPLKRTFSWIGQGVTPSVALRSHYQRGDQLLVRSSLLSHWSRSSNPFVM